MARAHTGRQEAEDALLQLLPTLRKRFESELPAELGDIACITSHQGEALHLLRTAPAVGLTMNELARAQGCALSTATAMVDRLIRLGVAQRVHDDHDRRLVRISMTDAGRALSQRFVAFKHEVVRKALEQLSDEEVSVLVRALGAVAAAFGDKQRGAA